MKFKYILGVDPSGNFYEGKGTTGFCLFDTTDNTIIKTTSISANDYETQMDYWRAVIMYIRNINYEYKDFIVVMEDFMLYATKADAQINSKMETPKLIGVIEFYCTEHTIPYILQPAHEVKNRWNNLILQHKRYIKKVGRNFYSGLLYQKKIDKHTIDSIRHAVHYATFKNKGD